MRANDHWAWFGVAGAVALVVAAATFHGAGVWATTDEGKIDISVGRTDPPGVGAADQHPVRQVLRDLRDRCAAIGKKLVNPSEWPPPERACGAGLRDDLIKVVARLDGIEKDLNSLDTRLIYLEKNSVEIAITQAQQIAQTLDVLETATKRSTADAAKTSAEIINLEKQVGVLRNDVKVLTELTALNQRKLDRINESKPAAPQKKCEADDKADDEVVVPVYRGSSPRKK